MREISGIYLIAVLVSRGNDSFILCDVELKMMLYVGPMHDNHWGKEYWNVSVTHF